jgi:hypothetical protein
MAPDDAVEKVATLADYTLADLVHAGQQLLARNRGKKPGAQPSSEMASSRMILPRDLKAFNETWMVCRWLQSCLSSSFWGLGVRAGQ